LEEVLIRTCADFGIPTKRISGLTGVWTAFDAAAKVADSSTQLDERGRPSPHGRCLSDQNDAKIAALGVHISRAVTSHGLALNVNTDLSFFNLIVPCGITSKPVTSLQKELGRVLPMEDVAHSLSRNFGTVFHSQILWLDNIDALLGNNLGVPMQLPENLRKLHGDEGPIRA
jgi:lipoyl(octanoyl) transferase